MNVQFQREFLRVGVGEGVNDRLALVLFLFACHASLNCGCWKNYHSLMHRVVQELARRRSCLREIDHLELLCGSEARDAFKVAWVGS